MRLFLPAALLLATATHAFGWGCEGHAIVALIARSHLTPTASAAIDQLLRENPIDPALDRYCKDRPQDLMADSATWADDIRKSARTGNWHFIDIPLNATMNSKLDEWCPAITDAQEGKDRTGCVTKAIEFNWSIVRDRRRLPADRATALRYVIHFIGDMHQPLHASDNDDRGGNCTTMTYYSEEKPTNLHTIWDSRVLQHSIATRNLSTVAYADALNTQFADNWHQWAESGIRLNDWAWENHKVAVEHTYGDLKPALPLRKLLADTNCDAERKEVADMHIAIGDPYLKTAAPIIDEQLAKAGLRLAALLNGTF